ncbi:hypothetical protein M6B38_267775 [Iris pallida]|uniref:Uncharacterized protein n=1 Tax=Iris pallida TaxID=29817 RepID=A0AAX6IB08_IRIPA|nr:hypothetical protein M6B38_267775 [Iris pallida]
MATTDFITASPTPTTQTNHHHQYNHHLFHNHPAPPSLFTNFPQIRHNHHHRVREGREEPNLSPPHRH